MENYLTPLSSIMEKLRKEGRLNEFKMSDGKLTIGNGKSYGPTELKIVKTYRFEGASDPDDAAVLYEIEDRDGGFGYVLDAYGAYSNSDEIFQQFMKEVPVEQG